MNLNLDATEQAALTQLLRDTIATDRCLLSPRIRCLKGILAKLDPSTPVDE